MLGYLDSAFERGNRGSTMVDPKLMLGEDLARPLSLFRQAVDLDPRSSALQWGLMRVSLKTGKAADVTPTFTNFLQDINSNPWFYQDLLLSYSQSGDHDTVIALFEEVMPPQTTDVIRDAVALAYLEIGGENGLYKAEQLRPGDLYVNYRLWQLALEADDDSRANLHRQRLEQFPLSAILPTDSQLLAYVAIVVPHLITEGIWNQEQTINVMAFLAWQNYDAEGTLQLAKHLSDEFPSAPEWVYYQAEIYHRRGQLEVAEAYYRQALLRSQTYEPALRGLAIALEQQVDEYADSPLLREAFTAYQQHYSLTGDLLSLTKLSTLCTVLRDGEESFCRELAARDLLATRLGSSDEYRVPAVLEESPDLRPLLALLLKLPEDQLKLGPNLIENGEFERWVGHGLPAVTGVRSRPLSWSWIEMYSRAPFNEALFYGNSDNLAAFEGKSVARVDGQWLQRNSSLEAARAGYWQFDEEARGLRKIPISPHGAYLLTFLYRTQGVADGRTTVWVASADEAGTLWSGSDPLLPATGGAWYRFIGIGWNPTSAPTVLQPLLRLYATGSVSFDNVVLQEIDFMDAKPASAEVQLFVIEGSQQ